MKPDAQQMICKENAPDLTFPVGWNRANFRGRRQADQVYYVSIAQDVIPLPMVVSSCQELEVNTQYFTCFFKLTLAIVHIVCRMLSSKAKDGLGIGTLRRRSRVVGTSLQLIPKGSGEDAYNTEDYDTFFLIAPLQYNAKFWFRRTAKRMAIRLLSL